MSAVFVAIYGVLTVALDLSGLYPGLAEGWQADIAASGVMLTGTLWLVALLGPGIELPRFGSAVNKDPVRWAVLVGFGAWLVAHNLVPGLWSLTEMSTTQAVSFTALNLLESTLFGVVVGL